MKKRVLSLCLTLAMVLAFLPSRAMAAGDSYGPYDGYGFTVDELEFDLGQIEFDGTEKTVKDVFQITIENTGEETLYMQGGSVLGGDGTVLVRQKTFTVEPGGAETVSYDMEIRGMAQYGVHTDQFQLFSFANGAQRDATVTYELVKPEQSSSGSSDNTAYMGTVSIETGEGAGFSVSSNELSFGTCFVGETPKPLYVTLTNTRSDGLAYQSDEGFFVVDGGYDTPVRWKLVEGELNAEGQLAPGKSLTYELTLETRKEGIGGVQYDGPFVVMDTDRKIMYKVGGVFYVDYEILPLSEKKSEGIAWEIDTKSIDFGTHNDVDYEFEGEYFECYFPKETKTISVTNKGDHEFYLETRVSEDEATKEMTSVYDSVFRGRTDQRVRPGETVTISVDAGGEKIRPGVAGGELQLTAYYEDSKEKNTLTATIPLTSKYLYQGGYFIQDLSDRSYGTVKGSDGEDYGIYSKNGYAKVKEGDSFTFVMTPHDPKNYTVVDILVDGKSVGAAKTYTFENVQACHTFEAVFGSGTDIKAPGAAEPAAWAEEAVDRGIELGLIPAELQSGYDQPITRRDFCVLAYKFYCSKEGELSVWMSPFTDVNDLAVTRMASQGIVNGVGDGLFAPNDSLTREQAATILSRLAAAVLFPKRLVEAEGEPTFDDNAAIASWAYEAVGQMQISGIMGGTGNNQFSPQMTYTREQSMVTIMRLYDIATEKLGR